MLMQKAHLYEALYLVNHGIDEAVRGVQRLKKAPHAFREVYYKSVAGLERRRALINGQFMPDAGDVRLRHTVLADPPTGAPRKWAPSATSSAPFWP